MFHNKNTGIKMPKSVRRVRTLARATKIIMGALPYLLLLAAGLKLVSAFKKVRFSAKDITLDSNTKLKHVMALGNVTLINSPAGKVVAGNMVNTDAPIKTAIAGNCIVTSSDIKHSISVPKKKQASAKADNEG